MRKISFFAVSFSSMSDEQLVLEIQKWKVTAFEEIYERRHKKIYTYLWNFLNYNYDDTTSLTSDVFIKLYQYVKENSLNNVRWFVYRLAHNLAIDWIRSNKSYSSLSLDQTYLKETLWYVDQYKHELDSSFKQKLFEKLLTYLDAQQREILYLAYQEKKSYQEIADIIWITKNSVWTLIFNAKKKLNDLAKNHWVYQELLS
jgi:RNA polymerase sigma-70 factor (ECF subfamily)